MSIFLGIESSCDETSVGIVENEKIKANIISSQAIHADFGGVVPELAARDHMKNILPVTKAALTKAGISLEDVDVFAATQQPGLIGSLLVGSQFTKSLALSLNKPFYAINHLKAHLVSPAMENPSLKPPYVCLLASGGHTQIVRCSSWLDMELIGQTLDDASGEAFDKSARLLGLPYSGGTHIDRLAKHGNPQRFKLPLPRMKNYNYSFSGLKTAIRYLVEDGKRQDINFVKRHQADLCASIQFAIIETLIRPFLDVAKKMHIKQLCIAGGVSANTYLRQRMQEECIKNGYTYYQPSTQYCGDNGAMVAFLAEKYVQTSQQPNQLDSPCVARHTGYSSKHD